MSFFLKGNKVNIYHFFGQGLFFVAILSVLTASTGGLLVGDGFHIGLIRNVTTNMLLMLFLLSNKIELYYVSRSILLLSIYLLLLIPFSSDPYYSLHAGYMRMIPHMLLFLVAFKYFKSFSELYKLVRLYALLISPLVLNFILGQLYSVGHSAYVEGTLYLGYARIGITNLVSILILPSLLFLHWNKRKSIRIATYAFIFICLAFVLLVMKRTGIIALFIGFFVYFIYMPQKPKTFIKISIVAVIIFAGFTFTGTLDNIFRPRYEARVGERRPIEEEGRTRDIQYSIKEFIEGDIWHRLFGSEVFNSKQYFGPKYYGRSRMIHGDLTKIFYGAGIVGLFLYVNVFVALFVSFRKMFKYLKKSKDAYIVRAVFNGVLSAYFIMLLPGAGQTSTSLAFLILGAIMGSCYHEIKYQSASSKYEKE